MTTSSLLSSFPLNLKSLESIQENGSTIPQYRQNKKCGNGIVHLGPGAFFRGHQAWYTHKAMEKCGGDWGITAVSMRSSKVKEALSPQDGLYTLVELDKKISHEVIGSISKVLVLGEDYNEVMHTLCSSTTYFVTLTITEKGYCLNANGDLDINHPDIIHDLIETSSKVSAIGLLAKALESRFLNSVAPFCVISCDNITDNGKRLKKALVKYTGEYNLALSDWLDEFLICPSTMVDSITPATDEQLKSMVSNQYAIQDNWPIKRESFLQWVIEDGLPEHRPAWEQCGAIFTDNVRGFEAAKLRLLNCPHSTIAYLGSLMEVETVYDAMQYEPLVRFVKDMLDSEVMPSIEPPKELDAFIYSRAILERFNNPNVKHLLSQIAWDGSQKLPIRILPIIEENLENNRSICMLCHCVAAWMLFLRKQYLADREIVDPHNSLLLDIVMQCNNNAEHDVNIFVSMTPVFSDVLKRSKKFQQVLTRVYASLSGVLDDPAYPWYRKLLAKAS
ncbi:mannitol dehydrogenase family protein [Agaribacter flavus]|uniref:Mannitol dehydrogenase family protein n=1 Tax=Agaribacter flavus TaxID=1902781 RepID=A0ABV7FQC7_9ALTE